MRIKCVSLMPKQTGALLKPFQKQFRVFWAVNFFKHIEISKWTHCDVINNADFSFFNQKPFKSTRIMCCSNCSVTTPPSPPRRPGVKVLERCDAPGAGKHRLK